MKTKILSGRVWIWNLSLVVALTLVFSPESKSQLTTEQLLDTLQHTAFDFFWNEANPTTGLIKDRSAIGVPSSIASVGFGLTALCIGAERGWQSRTAVRDRVLTTLRTLWQAPQGSGATGYAGYKGFYYHFLDMNTALRAWESELSNIDSGLLFAGIVFVGQYFDGPEPEEQEIRGLADSIYFRANWEWFRNYNEVLPMEWKPGQGFGTSRWYGYNEAMIMYILGYGSPTYPLKTGWPGWTSTYQWLTYYGYTYVNFPPLFGHQYSHCWVDFRGIQDAYMRQKGIDYFENSRRATLAQQAYCAANPGGFLGYSDSLWGITASDGPEGYNARGAPPAFNDNGTITPTAPISSLPFAPEAVIPTMHNLWNNYRGQLWGAYGFRDAFNLEQNWWATDVIGIDQGPIIVMIENFRTGMVWDVFMRSPHIQTGLSRIGFTPVTTAERTSLSPSEFLLLPNYPNPFNPTTRIEFSLPTSGTVTLRVLDLLGREVDLLLDGIQSAGSHVVEWDGAGMSSGTYIIQLVKEGSVRQRKAILLR